MGEKYGIMKAEPIKAEAIIKEPKKEEKKGKK
jgi:hypothetical protein